MSSMQLTRLVVGPVLVVLFLSVGWWTRDTWKTWLIAAKEEETPPEAPKDADKVKLSQQAKDNLRLVVKEVQPTTYWRKIYLPGTVVDRPGHSDRGISAPIAGVITQVNAVPGKTIRVGEVDAITAARTIGLLASLQTDSGLLAVPAVLSGRSRVELFRLRIVSDSFQSSQMDLYKHSRELEIARKEHKRLEPLASSGAVANTRLLELEYQRDRFQALIQAHRQDLLSRQLTPDQVSKIEKGQFVTEVVIYMPERLGKHSPHHTGESLAEAGPYDYEVQELKVNLGDHVQAGQILAYLADHRYLYIEGKALKHEARLLAQAAKEGWPVEAEFSEDDEHTAGDRLTNLSVEFLGNTMDASDLILPVYIPFVNPQREYVRHGKTYRTGQHRPGQKVLLKVAVAKLPDVFVVPIAGVVREGADAYVFRQNGAVFDRKPVHVIMEDAEVVVIADDGSLFSGDRLAHNAAAALNRTLKASAPAEAGHSH